MQRYAMNLVITLATILLIGAGTHAVAETLTLDQCIEIALDNNGSATYGLLSAREGYHQSKQGVWSAWGGLLPTFSNSYGYSDSRDYQPAGQYFNPITQEIETTDGGPVKQHGWDASFSLNQTLFDGGANWYRVAQSYHQRAANRESMRQRENEVIYGVNQKFFGLLKARKLVEVQEAAVRRAEEFLKTIESRYELGSASLSEVLKARVQLGTEQLELLNRKNNVEVARAELNELIGRPVDDDIDVTDISSEEPMVPTYDDAKQRALQGTPALVSQRARLRIAKDEIGIARATLFPTLSWSLRRSFVAPYSSDLLKFDGKDGAWSAGVGLSISLFNGFHRKTAISNARVGVKYSEEALSQTEKSVLAGVKIAHLSVKLAAETRDLAEQTEVSAQEDFNLAQEKYNLGAATILDLLDAQASLTKAQNDKVNALYDYFVAAAALDLAIGQRR